MTDWQILLIPYDCFVQRANWASQSVSDNQAVSQSVSGIQSLSQSVTASQIQPVSLACITGGIV